MTLGVELKNNRDIIVSNPEAGFSVTYRNDGDAPMLVAIDGIDGSNRMAMKDVSCACPRGMGGWVKLGTGHNRTREGLKGVCEAPLGRQDQLPRRASKLRDWTETPYCAFETRNLMIGCGASNSGSHFDPSDLRSPVGRRFRTAPVTTSKQSSQIYSASISHPATAGESLHWRAMLPAEKQSNREEAMPQPGRFEILVLGSGTGGKLLAWHMAQAGRRTAVVERKWIGGSCPNVACMPSKNEIWSAKAAHFVHHATEFGITTGPVAIDMAAVRQRKRDMVEAQIAAHLHNYKTSGTELIMGSGRFVAPKTLEVSLNEGGTRVLTGDQVFINVGTHAAIPGIPGLEAAQPFTHIEALELDYFDAIRSVTGS